MDSNAVNDGSNDRLEALKAALADRKEIADPAALVAAIGSRKKGNAALRRAK